MEIPAKMNQELIVQIPPIPTSEVHKSPVTIGFVPAWVVAVSVMALNGFNAGSACNGIGCDEEGNLLLYRKLSEKDKSNFPLLNHVEEVWFTYEFPIGDD